MRLFSFCASPHHVFIMTRVIFLCQSVPSSRNSHKFKEKATLRLFTFLWRPGNNLLTSWTCELRQVGAPSNLGQGIQHEMEPTQNPEAGVQAQGLPRALPTKSHPLQWRSDHPNQKSLKTKCESLGVLISKNLIFLDHINRVTNSIKSMTTLMNRNF